MKAVAQLTVSQAGDLPGSKWEPAGVDQCLPNTTQGTGTLEGWASTVCTVVRGHAPGFSMTWANSLNLPPAHQAILGSLTWFAGTVMSGRRYCRQQKGAVPLLSEHT